MGVLDEAIREHLELKRLHGADPGEVAHLERRALGPAEEPIEWDVDPQAAATSDPGDLDDLIDDELVDDEDIAEQKAVSTQDELFDRQASADPSEGRDRDDPAAEAPAADELLTIGTEPGTERGSDRVPEETVEIEMSELLNSTDEEPAARAQSASSHPADEQEPAKPPKSKPRRIVGRFPRR